MERVIVKCISGAFAGQEKVYLKSVAEVFEKRGRVKVLRPATAAPRPEPKADRKALEKKAIKLNAVKPEDLEVLSDSDLAGFIAEAEKEDR
jgi:hypothetical protein